ncbi:HAD family hydrolase [Mediterraneibacter massiliensis]|uniref:HAD family hydrolase n=1 Tax=Mediterraneibacter massiliensis TaxID=1720300 RepID=UPI003A7F3408
MNGEKKLTSYTRKILDRAIAKGTEIVIVTGRNWEEVPEDIKNFSGIHYMITANGARITEVETNKILGNIYCPIRKQKKHWKWSKNTSLYRIYIIRGKVMFRKNNIGKSKNIIRTRKYVSICARQENGYRI